jgi:hypothetical protein
VRRAVQYGTIKWIAGYCTNPVPGCLCGYSCQNVDPETGLGKWVLAGCERQCGGTPVEPDAKDCNSPNRSGTGYCSNCPDEQV